VKDLLLELAPWAVLRFPPSKSADRLHGGGPTGCPALADVISLNGLCKRYGDRTVVDDLSLEVRPGAVTGFLGPNGAGKSTAMRLILGLDRPTAGTALIRGVPYHRIGDPLRTVGALLDARAVHPGRSGRAHLAALARSNGIARGRVAEVLETVGLGDAAGRRAGTLSLGMSQRLMLLMGLPLMLLMAGGPAGAAVALRMPMFAGLAFMGGAGDLTGGPIAYPAGEGLVWLLAWTAVALAAGHAVLRARDA
jgi:ABC-type thiamine transport system ATPase subunit